MDRVYLWECEDLRRNFASADVENVMKCQYNIIEDSPFRSPILRQAAADSNALPASHASHHHTPYNKLITNHECILASIVRKPNMPTNTVAYMRAGPRKLLHFNPSEVNAAIVTCGGLVSFFSILFAFGRQGRSNFSFLFCSSF